MNKITPLAVLRKRAREKKDKAEHIKEQVDPTLNPEAGQYQRKRDNY